MAVDAGWYSDPQGAGLRWWDGAAWTEHTRADAAPAAAAPLPPAALPAASVDPAASADPWAGAQLAAVPAPPAALAPWPGVPMTAPFAPPPVGVWRGPVDDRPWVRTMADAVRVVLAKYAQFDGRASRSEYWYWVLSAGLCYLGLLACAIIPVVGFFALLVLLLGVFAVIVPNYAVAVRRLRDAGFHWGWIFLGLVPLGGIALIVLCAQPSKFP